MIRGPVEEFPGAGTTLKDILMLTKSSLDSRSLVTVPGRPQLPIPTELIPLMSLYPLVLTTDVTARLSWSSCAEGVRVPTDPTAGLHYLR